MSSKREIIPGGIDEYINSCPKEVQDKLRQIREAIQSVVPDAMETVSYFGFPGYHYDGDYAYNGMFAWFSYKAPFIRLHIYPEVIKKHTDELKEFKKTIGAINFPQEKQISPSLVKQLVNESLVVMKTKTK